MLKDWALRFIDDVFRDSVYAVRQLRRAPGFALATVLCLSLGIGVTTTIYSVVDTVLLQPLPFPDSNRLVRVIEHVPSTVPGRPPAPRGILVPTWFDWRMHAKTLSGSIAVTGLGQRLVQTSQGAAGLWGSATSPEAFTLLGVRAMLGRTFDPGDTDAMVLTFETWRRHFNADKAVVGGVLELHPGALQPSSRPRMLTVIGVLPADFEFPTAPSDFYIPLQPAGPQAQSARVTLIGRLTSGVSLEVAADELNAIGAAGGPPASGAAGLTGRRFEIQPLKDLAVRDLKPALGILLASVVGVLLIVCANVANLLLARGTARQREIAVRLAIGASRGRLVRQALTESLVLAMAGGAFGAGIGAAGVALVKRLATVDAPGIFGLMFGSTILPRAHEVHVDFSVLGIALSVAVVTSVVFGLLPALHLARARHVGLIGPSGRGVAPSMQRTRAILVVAQLGMATVLLVGAGLLVHSFVKLYGTNKGYDPANVVALQLLFPDDYPTTRKAETVGTLLTRLRQIPGVQAAGFSRHGLLIGEELTIGTFVPSGRTLSDMRADPSRLRVRAVSDGFLSAMSVPLLDGREFDDGDRANAATVIVINRSAARQLFGDARAVGQRVNWFVTDVPAAVNVVGVVEDLRQESLAQDTFPEVYVDYRQFLALMEQWPKYTARQNEWAIGFLSFAIQTTGASAPVISTVRQVVASVDPQIGIDALVPMTRLVADSVARERFSAVLLSAFAAVAAVLASIGVYGVLAYLVVQRTQEIGIRMALGARRAQVLGLVLRKGLSLSAAGITLGLVGAAALSRLLESMLFGITPLDWLTFAGVAVLFGLVTMVASYLPARRATLVDPLVALRSE